VPRFLADFRAVFAVVFDDFFAVLLAVLVADFLVVLRDPLFRLAMMVAGKVRRTGQGTRRRAAGTRMRMRVRGG
jgi:hypothetical protein